MFSGLLRHLIHLLGACVNASSFVIVIVSSLRSCLRPDVRHLCREQHCHSKRLETYCRPVWAYVLSEGILALVRRWTWRKSTDGDVKQVRGEPCRGDDGKDPEIYHLYSCAASLLLLLLTPSGTRAKGWRNWSLQRQTPTCRISLPNISNTRYAPIGSLPYSPCTLGIFFPSLLPHLLPVVEPSPFPPDSTAVPDL
jgi:hypothetical protein